MPEFSLIPVRGPETLQGHVNNQNGHCSLPVTPSQSGTEWRGVRVSDTIVQVCIRTNWTMKHISSENVGGLRGCLM